MTNLIQSCLAAVCIAATCTAGSIRLRTAAAVEPGAPIRVGDIATLEGEDALALASTTVTANASESAAGRAWATVTIADLRRALDESGVRLSMISLSGATCTVRITDQAPPVRSDGIAPRATESTPPGDRSRVRGAVITALASHLGAAGDSIRVAFAAADEPFLHQPRGDARIIAQPTSSPDSAHAVVAVRVYEGDRVADSRTLRAAVEVRRRVIVLNTALKRREEIAPSMLAIEERWLPPGGARLIESIEAAAGSLARTRLEPGVPLREDHLESPVIIRRNELVAIRSVHRGIELQSRARAKSEGRRGDLIEFCTEGSKRPFAARVVAPGLAVMDLATADTGVFEP